MVLRRSVLVGSLLLAAPGCQQGAQAPAAPEAKKEAAAPARPDAPVVGQSCDQPGATGTTSTGLAVHCSKGQWEDVDAGFVGVRHAGRSRATVRSARA